MDISLYESESVIWVLQKHGITASFLWEVHRRNRLQLSVLERFPSCREIIYSSKTEDGRDHNQVSVLYKCTLRETSLE